MKEKIGCKVYKLPIKYRKALIKRKKKVKFLAYFQPYTNTYAKKEVLKKLYDEVLGDEDIIGLCIDTLNPHIDKGHESCKIDRKMIGYSESRQWKK